MKNRVPSKAAAKSKINEVSGANFSTIIFLLFCFMFIILGWRGSVYAEPNVSAVFVLDESGSIDGEEFSLEKRGFVDALDALPADGSIEVAAVGFATSVETLKTPTILDSVNFSDIRYDIENNPKDGGSTNMGGAINRAAELLSNSSADTKIIFLATDGKPNRGPDTAAEAGKAKDAGIILTPVGIGMEDGNARLLVRVRTNFNKDVEFSVDTNKTESRFDNLTRTKTGQAVITIPTIYTGNDLYQATAVLTAEERFPGSANEPKISFNLKAAVKNNDKTDAQSGQKSISVIYYADR